MRKRGKFDFFVMLVWLVILGVVGGAGFWCWSNMAAAGDPANKANYWTENMYGYRSAMEAADRKLDQKDYAGARAAYEAAINANSQNERSTVLRDRVARAWFREGQDKHAAGQFEEAIRNFRSALEALRQRDSNVEPGRATEQRYEADITKADEVTDALVDSLVGEAHVQRVDLQALDAAEELLLEARERRPAHLGASEELIELYKGMRRASALLGSLRHALEHFKGPGTPEFQAADDHYKQLITDWTNRHASMVRFVLQNYPAQDWIPFVNGMVFQYHTAYSSQDSGEIRGEDFTRTMRVQGNTAFLERTPGDPDFILQWANVPNLGDFLVETWTPNINEDGGTRVYNLLPRNLQMGMSWPGGDGTTWTLSDLKSDGKDGFQLIITGWPLPPPVVITYGVGRTSVTPYGSNSSEYLDAVVGATDSTETTTTAAQPAATQ